MNLSLRRSTSALLASSLLLTIGRGATLPFMTIYLSRQYSLSVDLIGYAMTIALTIGVVFSLGCFVIGLIGFIFSGNSLLMWGMSAAVFTVGEIIYAPGEYMLIDHIAPLGMKASYFSAQSLGWLGAAINPLVSGIVLTSLPPFSLFIILALVIVAAWVLMLKGIRARPWGQPALC